MLSATGFNPDRRLEELELQLIVLEQENKRLRRHGEVSRLNDAKLLEVQRMAAIMSWETQTISGKLKAATETLTLFGLDNDPAPSFDDLLKVIHPDDVNNFQQHYEDSLNTGIPFELEHRIVTAQGNERIVIHHCKTFLAVNGMPLKTMGLMQDITERKKADAALWEAKERLEAAASAGIVGVWDWDIPNNELVWDKVMYRLYGLHEADFSGAYEAWASAVHPDDRAYAEMEIQAALRGERSYAPEFKVVWPDGSIHHIKAASRTTFDSQGKPLRMIGVNYDITEQKNIEEMLQEGVAKRTEELQKLRQVAEIANIAKSAFLANMSHEMRTPLHQISGLSALVKRDTLSLKQSEYLDKLDISCRNLTAIIDTILELTRIEAGQFDIAEAPFSLDGLLRDVVAQAQDQATAKRLHLSTELGHIPAHLIGDKNLLQQALLNYVTNAIRFTEVGSVDIRVNVLTDITHNALVRFEVTDTGMGIEPDALPRLFNIFEQADMSSTRKYGGVGLGLAMTKKIAEIMGGDAGCDSKLSEGSTFWFTVLLKKSAIPVGNR